MALFIANKFMNQGTADMTVEMGEATYPVVSVNYNGFLINEMHGYAKAMKVSQMRESITPLLRGEESVWKLIPTGKWFPALPLR